MNGKQNTAPCNGVNMILFLILFTAWAIIHSLTATFGLKRMFRRRFGDRAYAGWYRLFYNGFSILTFMPVYWLIPSLLPDTILWQWPRPYNYLALIVQFIGLAGLLYSLWVTNIWGFLGLRQVIWYLKGSQTNTPQPKFIVHGPYALVRHPLYFFSLLLLWFNPIMMVSNFIFYLLATLYFYIGSFYEERKLAASFGDPYHTYQQRVPRLFPFIRLS